jgi:hypothetical protein
MLIRIPCQITPGWTSQLPNEHGADEYDTDEFDNSVERFNTRINFLVRKWHYQAKWEWRDPFPDTVLARNPSPRIAGYGLVITSDAAVPIQIGARDSLGSRTSEQEYTEAQLKFLQRLSPLVSSQLLYHRLTAAFGMPPAKEPGQDDLPWRVKSVPKPDCDFAEVQLWEMAGDPNWLLLRVLRAYSRSG